MGKPSLHIIFIPKVGKYQVVICKSLWRAPQFSSFVCLSPQSWALGLWDCNLIFCHLAFIMLCLLHYLQCPLPHLWGSGKVLLARRTQQPHWRWEMLMEKQEALLSLRTMCRSSSLVSEFPKFIFNGVSASVVLWSIQNTLLVTLFTSLSPLFSSE